MDGWAPTRLAVKFDVSPSTVTNTLRRAGVPAGQGQDGDPDREHGDDGDDPET
jgi:hypothetical protein